MGSVGVSRWEKAMGMTRRMAETRRGASRAGKGAAKPRGILTFGPIDASILNSARERHCHAAV